MDAAHPASTPSNAPRAELKYDFHGAAFYEDPYPYYARMRAEDPVWRNPISGHWVVTRYRDVLQVLSADHGSDRRLGELLARLPPDERELASPLRAALVDRLLFLDGPAHQRIRRLVMHSFSASAIDSLEPLVQSIVDDVLNGLDFSQPLDLIAAATNKIPGRVILHVLGFPEAEQEEMKAWTDRVYDWLGTAQGTIEERTAGAVEAVGRLEQAILERAARARRAPSQDMISTLVHAQEDEHVLNDRELLANVLGLINAGQETTTCLLANGALALMRFPDQRALLRARPDLLDGAIEEFLRFDSPAQFIVRRVEQPMRLSGVELDAGAFVSVGLGAANRDPDVFPHPDQLDITRDLAHPPHHMAFAMGSHFCVGSRLARLEARIFFRELERRFPDLELAGAPEELEWRHTVSFRSPVRLPVVRAGARGSSRTG